MFSRHHRKLTLLFGLSDILLITLAFEGAYQSRLALNLERLFYIDLPVRALLLGFSMVVWLLMGRWFSIYERLDSASPRVILQDSFRQCSLGIIAVVLFEYSLRLDLSRLFLGLFGIYSWMALCLFRLNSRRIVRAVRSEMHYVMIAGTGDRARRLGETIERSEQYGIRLQGFLGENDALPSGTRIQLERDYPVYPIAELPSLLRKDVIDEIIFAVDTKRLASLEEIFLICDEEGVRTRVAVDFFPHMNSEVYLDRLGNSPLLTFSATPHDEVRLLVKRGTDVVLACAGLVLLAPLMLLVAMAIRVTSRGPAIFRQVRCGLNGRRFVFYKFRSMCDNAEELKASLEHLNQKSTAFKIPNDPRLTPIGRWLRKFSIDEWPQLWNVLKGDMSLVGPRPAVPEEVERYQAWQRRRLRMRPGLTCLWALKGRDSLDFETWMKMDMQYIDNWSLALDWNILLRTIPRVVSGKGAH
jgi:exopolysaccharide biosynthesis polyprenyl glycosylphosphotransferase